MKVSTLELKKFLKDLNLSQWQKQEFILMHKFVLEFQKNFFETFHFLGTNPIDISFAGGSVRDNLLLGTEYVKDYDLVITLNSTLSTEFLASNIAKSIESGSGLFSNIKTSYSSPNFHDELITELKALYKQSSSNTQSLLLKCIINAYINNFFIANFSFVEKSGITSEEKLNDYHFNENALIGVVKSNFNGKEVDFLLTTNENYIFSNFDFHICHAIFPKQSHLQVINHTVLRNYENCQKTKDNVLNYYMNKLTEIEKIEQNIDIDEIFLSYLGNYLDLSPNFISNYKNKELTVTLIDRKNYEKSFRNHYQRIFKKYPFPIHFRNDLYTLDSLNTWMKEEKIE